VCGAAMLFRMDRFESVGFFDENFFLYYEDDDGRLWPFDKNQ
jgi:GT2 family glycosyltransferase